MYLVLKMTSGFQDVILISDVRINVYLIGNCRCLRTTPATVFLRDSTGRFELNVWEKLCPVFGCFGQILVEKSTKIWVEFQCWVKYSEHMIKFGSYQSTRIDSCEFTCAHVNISNRQFTRSSSISDSSCQFLFATGLLSSVLQTTTGLRGRVGEGCPQNRLANGIPTGASTPHDNLGLAPKLAQRVRKGRTWPVRSKNIYRSYSCTGTYAGRARRRLHPRLARQ